MHQLRVTTIIRAPIERCFDFARSVDAHVTSASATNERVVAGRMSGLLEFGEVVTWEARHLGVTQRLTSRITVFDRPRFFQDRMERGAFKKLEHDHVFKSIDAMTTEMMIDVVRFEAPFGPIGWLAERLMVGPHLRQFLVARAASLKAMAERSSVA